MGYDEIIRERRELLKAPDYDKDPPDPWWEPHQRKGIEAPPLEKPYNDDDVMIDLVCPDDFKVQDTPIIDAIRNRESRRAYTDEPLTLEELSFLLWATQGVRVVDEKRVWTKRATPSGGGRQPYETYLLVNRVESLERGIYRYLPIEHKLVVVSDNLPHGDDLMEKAWYQAFIGKAPIVFVWAAIPYKMEWRYSIIAYKDILIEAGHICQNLYLACEAVGLGTCAIAAYEQRVLDDLIQVDGENEITVYIAPVGKVT